ncbi:MAG: DUF3768 domain-containing protein [Alphaproteobacteria bacterium]
MSEPEQQSVKSKERVITIQKLNDMLRCNWVGGEIVITQGVSELVGGALVGDVLYKMGNQDDFTAENDPHGEHDFGVFEEHGHKFFWKIDYYNLSKDGHSPDPANPHVTCRVLTLMLASEY